MPSWSSVVYRAFEQSHQAHSTVHESFRLVKLMPRNRGCNINHVTQRKILVDVDRSNNSLQTEIFQLVPIDSTAPFADTVQPSLHSDRFQLHGIMAACTTKISRRHSDTNSLQGNWAKPLGGSTARTGTQSTRAQRKRLCAVLRVGIRTH